MTFIAATTKRKLGDDFVGGKFVCSNVAWGWISKRRNTRNWIFEQTVCWALMNRCRRWQVSCIWGAKSSKWMSRRESTRCFWDGGSFRSPVWRSDCEERAMTSLTLAQNVECQKWWNAFNGGGNIAEMVSGCEAPRSHCKWRSKGDQGSCSDRIQAARKTFRLLWRRYEKGQMSYNA